MPVPVAGIVRVVPAPVEMVTAPVMLPAFFGANSTVSMAVSLGAIDVPELIPLALNPVTLDVVPLMVMLEFPELSRATFAVVNPFTATSPNLTLIGLAARTRVAPTALPISGITKPDALPLTGSVRIPPKAPVAIGENIMLNVVVPPDAIVAGAISPDVLNPVPWISGPVIVTLEVARFLN